MNDSRIVSIPQVKEFIKVAKSIEFQGVKSSEKYAWINDILLARIIETDKAHDRLSGPATKKIFEREYQVFGNKAFSRLKDISVSHLYYHRPCGFATTRIDAKGKIKKVYNLYRTPYETLVGHPRASEFLKDGVSWEKLEAKSA